MKRRTPEKRRRNKKLKKVSHAIEYAALHAFIGILDRISPAAAFRLISPLVNLYFRLGRRRHIAEENILRAGITAEKEEATRIARESFHHFASLCIESLKSDTILGRADWRDHITLDIPEETLALLRDKERGVLLVSGHLGNWEMAAQVLSTLKPVVGITRPMNNPRVQKFMEERKPRHQFRLVWKRGATATRFLTTLKDGEMLALMIDQYARDSKVVIDFFGQPAPTYASPALLHLVTGAPLCFGYCVRTGPMKFLMKALPPISHRPSGDREKDVRAILSTLTAHLEDAIRQYPEQYLWAHRRWRTG